tara:strand:- start:19646 stop:20215 length:570 start_codon:yes stop_codon:yes gene_type:complete
MKARLLRKLLNDTGYSISNNEGYIAVGSPMCHDLIKVDKETLKVKYSLDTWNKGRAYLEQRGNEELLFIWDKLHELIVSGAIKEIIEGRDHIENPLPVFTVYQGKLVESVTDEYGWPNTDDNGICMYENTHFPTAKEALEKGLSDSKGGVENMKEIVEDRKRDLQKAKDRMKMYEDRVQHLTNELKSLE